MFFCEKITGSWEPYFQELDRFFLRELVALDDVRGMDFLRDQSIGPLQKF
jgi:hypothetical protein